MTAAGTFAGPFLAHPHGTHRKLSVRCRIWHCKIIEVTELSNDGSGGQAGNRLQRARALGRERANVSENWLIGSGPHLKGKRTFLTQIAALNACDTRPAGEPI